MPMSTISLCIPWGHSAEIYYLTMGTIVFWCPWKLVLNLYCTRTKPRMLGIWIFSYQLWIFNFCINRSPMPAYVPTFPLIPTSIALLQYDSRGRNFLHLAVQKGDIEGVLFLIGVHVNVNSRLQDSSQLSPLHLAVQIGSEMIVRNLVSTHVRKQMFDTCSPVVDPTLELGFKKALRSDLKSRF